LAASTFAAVIALLVVVAGRVAIAQSNLENRLNIEFRCTDRMAATPHSTLATREQCIKSEEEALFAENPALLKVLEPYWSARIDIMQREVRREITDLDARRELAMLNRDLDDTMAADEHLRNAYYGSNPSSRRGVTCASWDRSLITCK